MSVRHRMKIEACIVAIILDIVAWHAVMLDLALQPQCRFVGNIQCVAHVPQVDFGFLGIQDHSGLDQLDNRQLGSLKNRSRKGIEHIAAVDAPAKIFVRTCVYLFRKLRFATRAG